MYYVQITTNYKLVRPIKDKDPGPSHEFIIRERSFLSALEGGGGDDGVVPQLINNDRSLNEHLALSR